jgi:hypothetical protein
MMTDDDDEDNWMSILANKATEEALQRGNTVQYDANGRRSSATGGAGVMASVTAGQCSHRVQGGLEQGSSTCCWARTMLQYHYS